MSEIILKIVSFSEAETEIRSVRQAVFQAEQGIASVLDFDGNDDTAKHIVCYAERPIGTARIRYLSDRLAKLERVAVLANYRHRGLGKQIVKTALDFLEQQGIAEVKVHAQKQTISFYQNLGFNSLGEEFYEADIIHVEMKRFCSKASSP